MLRRHRDDEFTEFVAARSAQLVRTAFLLCGDRHKAEDLVQITLTKLYLAWPRVDRLGGVDAYARRILVRASIDESRRPWRRERPGYDPASGITGPAATESHPPVDERSAVLVALRGLPTRQRAAVVLRHWHDLSVDETAALMHCSTSAVKTHCARGLERLRAALEPTDQGAPS